MFYWFTIFGNIGFTTFDNNLYCLLCSTMFLLCFSIFDSASYVLLILLCLTTVLIYLSVYEYIVSVHSWRLKTCHSRDYKISNYWCMWCYYVLHFLLHSTISLLCFIVFVCVCLCYCFICVQHFTIFYNTFIMFYCV